MSTGEYLTKVRIISQYLEYEFTTEPEQASRLNDFDSQLILKRLRTLREERARMHNLTIFDWSDLRYFLAVAREGSSVAAGRVLRVNQSTVHRRLAEVLERAGQRGRPRCAGCVARV